MNPITTTGEFLESLRNACADWAHMYRTPGNHDPYHQGRADMAGEIDGIVDHFTPASPAIAEMRARAHELRTLRRRLMRRTRGTTLSRSFVLGVLDETATALEGKAREIEEDES